MTSQHMTDDPLSLGTQYGLGTHRATYKVPTMSQYIASDWVRYIICLVIFIICIIGIGLLVRSDSVYYGSDSFVILVIFLILGSLAYIILEGVLENVYYLIRYRTLGLFLYDDGFIYGMQTSRQAVSWQNVQAVWHEVIVSSSISNDPTPTRHVYTINYADGAKITIDKLFQLKNMVQIIGHVIETETARSLFPAALNRYRMGQPVVFGPLTVTQEGLSHWSQMLLWSEVESIKIRGWAIVLRKQGKRSDWASVKLGVVPNVEVFKRVVQHVTSETARQLFPAILNRYQMGQPVVFGSLTVTQEGLSHRSHRLPWTRIKRRRILANEISESRLVIRELGKRFAWASVNLDAPQIEVFWMLEDHMRGVSLSEV